jgi:hypothetical protein
LFYQSLMQRLSPRTSNVLTQARTPQEWNVLYLSSPDFMHR